METLEVRTAEFKIEPQMRCQGSCKGSCSCPTGHCRCKRMSEVYSSVSEQKNVYGMPSADSKYFLETA